MSPSIRQSGSETGRTVDAVVVGAGQSGLAMSRHLAARSIEHVVLERGEVANSWRRDRWDSLRLLTPNWQTRLPGTVYEGDDPHGFMRAREVAEFISKYAADCAAPVRTGVTVEAVEPTDAGYRVFTDCGVWSCRSVVMASGAFGLPIVPAVSADMPTSMASCTSLDYRNPDRLEDGGVLVVGASASGLQLADEIQRSGRPVTLAVGEHVRMLRTYRGRDIQWWMEAAGVLDQRYEDVDDIARARRVPSPQLVGTADRTTLDLNALLDRGVRLVGRLVGVRDGKAYFSGSLPNHCAMADLKLGRLLASFDEWATERGIDGELSEPFRPEPTRVSSDPRLTLNLADHGIRSVVWATGLRPDYSWLRVPAFDRKGRLRHDGGVVAAPGVYVMGLPFMRRRRSSYIHGADDDARELCAHLAVYLNGGADRREHDVVERHGAVRVGVVRVRASCPT
jgi:putative flavoprotein involved in K+ transport